MGRWNGARQAVGWLLLWQLSSCATLGVSDECKKAMDNCMRGCPHAADTYGPDSTGQNQRQQGCNAEQDRCAKRCQSVCDD